MTKTRIEQFRRTLEAMDARARGDIQGLEEQARTGLGGEAGGDLSNTPMHLADLGTEQYLLDRRHRAAGENASGLEDPDEPFTDDAPRRRAPRDTHAAGTAGGGTAIGGLAGTNIGEGDPDDGDLEGAMGSGDFDQELDEDHEDTSPGGNP